MTAEKHNKLIGYLLLANGIITAFGAIIVAVFLTEIIVSSVSSGDAIRQMIGASFVLMNVAIAVAGLVLVVPQLLGGWMLLWKRPSARGWGIAAGIFAMCCVPIGTIIGIYAVWFLSGEKSRRFYSAGEPPIDYPVEKR